MVMAALLASIVTFSGHPASAVGTDACADSRESTMDSSYQTGIFPLKERDLPVIVFDGAVLFTAGMTIDADGAPNAYGPHNHGLDYTASAKGAHGWVSVVTDRSGRPVVQKIGPYRGYYISTTSLRQGHAHNLTDPRQYVDATRIPYIALPPDFAAQFGIRLGDLARVTNHANGSSAYAVFADVGPRGRIGEGSIALARKLGIPSNPRRDSAAEGVTYLVFPGSTLPSGGLITAAKIRSRAVRLYHSWGGTERVSGCALAVAPIR
jgi:hypothetical protein